MTRWRNFLDSLDTPGGHVFLMLALAVALSFSRCAGMEKFQAEAIGALLMACRGVGNGSRPAS